jgi:signal transduction histidine kinase
MVERRWDGVVDTVIAVVATLAALAAAIERNQSSTIGTILGGPGTGRREFLFGTGHVPATPALALLGVVLTTAPLAFRRRYPATSFGVIIIAVIATSSYSTAVTFAAVIFAAYSAVVYSKHQRLALLSVTTAAIIVTAAFPNTTPPVPARFTAFLVLVPTVAVAVAMRRWRQRAGDSAARLVQAEAEHEAETRRAVEAERSRIASELHDVVTHNVSVMVVQAGAARRVLGSSPDQAREAFWVQTAIEALLAVEASGRTAMGELRHLLGLLAPSGEAPDGDDATLVPQPDVGQVRSLVERVRAAGLPVELTITGARALPPGVDLAAYRVVQEALTNVIKHASHARSVVRIEYLPCELLIDVADDGRPADPAAAGAAAAAGSGSGPARSQPPGTGGRGLIGLRERIAIYGGDLDAGPRPGGGWRVRAKIPLEPVGSVGSVGPELQANGVSGVSGANGVSGISGVSGINGVVPT